MAEKILSEPIECGYKTGRLPSCAPLGASYVPFQQEQPPKYANSEAIVRGTLFPGLDLPFKNIVNNNMPYAGTPLGELMALCFVQKELNLYLDTHQDDGDAFEMLQRVIELTNEGRRRYVKQYGPLTLNDLEYCDSYKWLRDPWPWEYSERRGQR